jgi:hypothetical protein
LCLATGDDFSSLLKENVADLSIGVGRSCEGPGLINARIIEFPQDLMPCGAINGVDFNV